MSNLVRKRPGGTGLGTLALAFILGAMAPFASAQADAASVDEVKSEFEALKAAADFSPISSTPTQPPHLNKVASLAEAIFAISEGRPVENLSAILGVSGMSEPGATLEVLTDELFDALIMRLRLSSELPEPPVEHFADDQLLLHFALLVKRKVESEAADELLLRRAKEYFALRLEHLGAFLSEETNSATDLLNLYALLPELYFDRELFPLFHRVLRYADLTGGASANAMNAFGRVLRSILTGAPSKLGFQYLYNAVAYGDWAVRQFELAGGANLRETLARLDTMNALLDWPISRIEDLDESDVLPGDQWVEILDLRTFVTAESGVLNRFRSLLSRTGTSEMIAERTHIRHPLTGIAFDRGLRAAGIASTDPALPDVACRLSAPAGRDQDEVIGAALAAERNAYLNASRDAIRRMTGADPHPVPTPVEILKTYGDRSKIPGAANLEVTGNDPLPIPLDAMLGARAIEYYAGGFRFIEQARYLLETWALRGCGLGSARVRDLRASFGEELHPRLALYQDLLYVLKNTLTLRRKLSDGHENVPAARLRAFDQRMPFFSVLDPLKQLRLSGGVGSICASDRYSANCWGAYGPGFGTHFRRSFPLAGFAQPLRGLGAGFDQVCLVDGDGKPRCRLYSNGQVSPSEAVLEQAFSKPLSTMAMSGPVFGSFIDGSLRYALPFSRVTSVPFPELLGLGQIRAPIPAMCGFSENFASCHDLAGRTIFNSGGFNGIVSMAATHGTTCVLDRDALKCFPVPGSHPAWTPPTFKNPRSLTAGYNHLCALDDEGIKCWGPASPEILSAPAATGLRAIAAAHFHTCALSDLGVYCWGLGKDGPSKAPEASEFAAFSAELEEMHQAFGNEPGIDLISGTDGADGSINAEIVDEGGLLNIRMQDEVIGPGLYFARNDLRITAKAGGTLAFHPLTALIAPGRSVDLVGRRIQGPWVDVSLAELPWHSPGASPGRVRILLMGNSSRVDGPSLLAAMGRSGEIGGRATDGGAIEFVLLNGAKAPLLDQRSFLVSPGDSRHKAGKVRIQ